MDSGMGDWELWKSLLACGGIQGNFDMVRRKASCPAEGFKEILILYVERPVDLRRDSRKYQYGP